jgi:HAD superfamily hydrolase (TIGR01450 family)
MKKAIILAAGIGSRLRPLTEYKPKTLVEVDGKPILGHTIDALLKNDVRDIVIVCGYLAQTIRDYCERAYPGNAFTFIENTEYDSTNNLYSLYLARKHLTEDIIVMNGDLVFDASIIKKLKTEKTSSVAVDVGRYIEESMKIIVEGGTVRHISKKITPEDAYGCSIDIYKFIKSDAKALVAELERTIAGGNRMEWTEVGLDRLFASQKIKARPCPIDSARWFEIDNLEDLHYAETLFNPKRKELKNKKIFFVDNDGTLSLDHKLLPQAKEFIDALLHAKKIVYLCSNNSSYTPAEHGARIRKQGLPFKDEQVLISTQAAMAFLKQAGIRRVYWVANKAASAWLKKSGFIFDAKKPEALLLCYDTEITYAKLEELTHLVRAGVPYYATHIDKVCPTGRGPVPDIGLFIDMIEATTGHRPLKTFGKPDKNFILPILKSHKLSVKDAVIIGDRLYTDIALGTNSGALSVLTLSGETKRPDYESSSIRADVLVKDVGELIPLINAKNKRDT